MSGRNRLDGPGAHAERDVHSGLLRGVELFRDVRHEENLPRLDAELRGDPRVARRLFLSTRRGVEPGGDERPEIAGVRVLAVLSSV